MLKQLSNGLILRSLKEGTPQDKQNLPQFYVDSFVDVYGPEDEVLGPWAADIISGRHPTITDEDVYVVVDPAHDERIVSALMLIPQLWHYENIPLKIGRVELVATHPEYRNQGLVRELFEVIHARSEALGHNIQAITGISYFYRQFGYAMAVDLGFAGSVPLGALGKPKEDASPEFTLRAATLADIPKLMAWQTHFAQKHLLSYQRPAEHWEYELSIRNLDTQLALNFWIITRQDGTEVGYVTTYKVLRQQGILCLEYAVGEESSYLATFDDVMRGLSEIGLAQYQDNPPYCVRFASGLYGTLQPFLKRTGDANALAPDYAWYLRVVDFVKLIWDLQPVLEQRLVNSRAHGYTGQLHINLYSKKGLLIRFENGRIVEVNDSAPKLSKDNAAFPYHSFLNVIFGHRSAADLMAILPDAYADRKATILLDALFPVKSSAPIGLA